MKNFSIILKYLLISTAILSSWQCSSQKIELENAQSQNIDFLISQAKIFWEQRSDSNAVIKANQILGLANKVENNNSELLSIYSNSLFFQGMFLEQTKTKKDSLFFKGAEVAKYSVLNDSIFITILNKTEGDSNFKILSALSIAPKDLVPSMYWWATNKLWYLNNKPAIERINHRELLEIIMHRIISLDPDYLYGGPYRFFGVFYSRIPGVEISQSKKYFQKAIASSPNYFGNKVQMAEFFHQKAENRNLFNHQLKSVIDINPSIDSRVIPENIFYQKRAKQLLIQEDTLFE
ncbi:MAG: hypothetical protein CMG41_02045 [Candidatus Marinimicrobia bacterium]|nr:hypothetical protein [Candidatus Neomarinimicrobiota bacterium]|tara:strand:- start:204 stop:1079 length:876 start_codon:yes stop_codon:yes gene_type:complete